MARYEKQGKDDQKIRNKLFANVGKLADLEGQETASQAVTIEVPAVAKAASEPKPVTAPQQTEESTAHNSASIQSEQDFVTATGVTRLQPTGISKEFAPGKVYVFAQVHAPKEEEILTLKWYDGDGKELWERQLKVRRNLNPGFRTYAFKTLTKAGSYEVRLLNEEGDVMQKRNFIVRES